MSPLGMTEAWLVDDRWAKAYPLEKVTTIGRGADSMIILRDPAVSRHHADLTKEDRGFVLRAQGASGARVNGAPVSHEWVMREGDVIEIAFTTLRFTLKAPTGEMFVLKRDTPTIQDSHDAPTRATLHALHPITLVARWKRWWHFIAGLVLLILMLLILLALGLR
jgi:hypothetical protein